MSASRDPVDDVFKTLRASDWHRPSPDAQLENRLMQQYHTTPRRFAGHSRTLAFALAFVAVGGVAFAASGGVERIKSWFVTLEVDGQKFDVQLDEAGEHVGVYETQDGGEAEVRIQATEDGQGNRLTRVDVTKTTPDDGTTRVVEQQRQVTRGGHEIESYDLPAGATPHRAWTDEEGIDRALYVLPTEKGDGSFLVLAELDADGLPQQAHRLPTPPLPPMDEKSGMTIDINEAGELAIIIVDEDGNEREMVLRITQRRSHEEPARRTLRTGTPEGDVKVEVRSGD